MIRGIWNHQINISICTGLGDEKVQCKTENRSILWREIDWTVIIEIMYLQSTVMQKDCFKWDRLLYINFYTMCNNQAHWVMTHHFVLDNQSLTAIVDSIRTRCYIHLLLLPLSLSGLRSLLRWFCMPSILYWLRTMVQAVGFATLSGMFTTIMYSVA